MRLILLLFILIATPAWSTNLFVEWDYDTKWDHEHPTNKVLDGFRLFIDGKLVNDITDPTSRDVKFVPDIEYGNHVGTMISYFEGGGVSQSSPEYAFVWLRHPDVPTVFLIIK